MAKLLFDIGNSCIKASVASGTAISPLFTISSRKLISAGKLYRLLTNPQQYHVLGCCSVNRKWDKIIIALAAKLKIPLKQIDEQLLLQLPSPLKAPEKVGADLRLYGYSALNQGHRDALIVALGTASTITIIKDGQLAGGIISLGLYSSLSALTTFAPAIKIDHINYSDQLMGRNTQEAIDIGVVNLYGYGLDAMIKRLTEPNKATAIILTGGNAPLLHHFLEALYPISYQPMILFEGLNTIIDEQST